MRAAPERDLRGSQLRAGPSVSLRDLCGKKRRRGFSHPGCRRATEEDPANGSLVLGFLLVRQLP
jgi:hypothetical protein